MSALFHSNKYIVFEQYRYQLVPISTNIQLTIEGVVNSYEDLVYHKNEFLFRVLDINNFRIIGRGTELIYKVLGGDDNARLIKLGKEKEINIDTKDFTEETISTYPNVYIYFDNNPEHQFIYVQRNYKAFSSTQTVINLLEGALNRYLHKLQLKIYIKPIIEKEGFWDIVNSYQGVITKLSFELIKPNLANISSTLTDDLKSLQKNTNSHTTKLELNAPTGRTLENINQTNQDVAGIVDYAISGGGDVGVKAKGIRKTIRTDNHTEISIDELYIVGKSETAAFSVLKELLQ